MTCRLVLLVILILPAHLLASPTFSVTGAVLQPGEYYWKEGARLHDASVAAQVAQGAWFMGATLQRDSAKTDQQKLKLGLLFDLRSAKVRSRFSADPTAQQLIDKMIAAVQAMPVTGRIQVEMNPLKQRLIQYNPLLEPGDVISYSTRPSSIKVTGAVMADCELTHVYSANANTYLDSCPPHPLAATDTLYIIQPDGVVQHVGHAYWNQQKAPIAVGATLYIPINEALLEQSGNPSTFNEDMAAFIATQTPQKERLR